MSEYFGLNVLSNFNQITANPSYEPDFMNTLMQLGSGPFALQENVPLSFQSFENPKTQPDLNENNLQVYQNKNDVSPTGVTSERALQSDPDIWVHLNSVAHDFKSNLKELLTSNHRGQEFLHALTYFRINSTSLMASILIDNELREDPDKRIERKLFVDWAHNLVLLVPTTNLDLWYRPPSGTSDGQRSPGGVLYEKYTYKRRCYLKIGRLKSQKKLHSLRNQRTDVNPTNTEIDNIRWLENNDEPREEVITKWLLTQNYRLNAFGNCSIGEYLEKFKFLKRSDGYILLDMDFDGLYPGCKNQLFSKFSRIAEGLLEVAKHSASPKIKSFLYEHRELINEGKLEVLAFLLLPLLLGSVRTAKAAAKRKSSRLEILDLFILHVENLDDLQPKLEARLRNLQSSKNTCQPFAVFIGPIRNLISSYVVIKKVGYNLCSPIKAIDLCFKSFFALDAKYQDQTYHCWLFMETYVYEISRNMKKYACVDKLISALNAYFSTHEQARKKQKIV